MSSTCADYIPYPKFIVNDLHLFRVFYGSASLFVTILLKVYLIENRENTQFAMDFEYAI